MPMLFLPKETIQSSLSVLWGERPHAQRRTSAEVRSREEKTRMSEEGSGDLDEGSPKTGPEESSSR